MKELIYSRIFLSKEVKDRITRLLKSTVHNIKNSITHSDGGESINIKSIRHHIRRMHERMVLYPDSNVGANSRLSELRDFLETQGITFRIECDANDGIIDVDQVILFKQGNLV